MIAAREGMSGGGWTTRLQGQCFWSTNTKPAGVASTSRVQATIPRCELNMADPKIAPARRVRKWHTEYSPHKIPVNVHNAKRRLWFEVRL